MYRVIDNESIINGIKEFETLKEARAYARSRIYFRPNIYGKKNRRLKYI